MDGGEEPPPAATSLLYVLLTDEGVYVGETDRGEKRMRAHRESRTLTCAFVVPCENKTRALTLQTLAIRELQRQNVRLVSVHDGQLEVRE